MAWLSSCQQLFSCEKYVWLLQLHKLGSLKVLYHEVGRLATHKFSCKPEQHINFRDVMEQKHSNTSICQPQQKHKIFDHAFSTIYYQTTETKKKRSFLIKQKVLNHQSTWQPKYNKKFSDIMKHETFNYFNNVLVNDSNSEVGDQVKSLTPSTILNLEF